MFFRPFFFAFFVFFVIWTQKQSFNHQRALFLPFKKRKRSTESVFLNGQFVSFLIEQKFSLIFISFSRSLSLFSVVFFRRQRFGGSLWFNQNEMFPWLSGPKNIFVNMKCLWVISVSLMCLWIEQFFNFSILALIFRNNIVRNFEFSSFQKLKIKIWLKINYHFQIYSKFLTVKSEMTFNFINKIVLIFILLLIWWRTRRKILNL